MGIAEHPQTNGRLISAARSKQTTVEGVRYSNFKRKMSKIINLRQKILPQVETAISGL